MHWEGTLLLHTIAYRTLQAVSEYTTRWMIHNAAQPAWGRDSPVKILAL